MMRWWLAMALVLPGARAITAEPTAAQVEFFETKVRPILADHCYSCHGPKKQSGGLRLDSAADLKAGIDGKPVVVAGDIQKSKLIQAVSRKGEFPMPPKTALPPGAVASLTEWVKTGAAIPADRAVKNGAGSSQHWAFQPVRIPVAPVVANVKHAFPSDIDSFVSAKLSDRGLSLAAPADRRTAHPPRLQRPSRPSAHRRGSGGVRDEHRPPGVGKADR